MVVLLNIFIGDLDNGLSLPVKTIERSKPMYLYKLRTNWLGRSFIEKDFSILVAIKLQMSLQCALALLKASSILGYISKKTASELKKFFPFLPLLRQHASTVSSSELPSTRKALTYWNMFRVELGDHQNC